MRTRSNDSAFYEKKIQIGHTYVKQLKGRFLHTVNLTLSSLNDKTLECFSVY